MRNLCVSLDDGGRRVLTLGNVSIEDLKGDELSGLRVLVVDDEPETLELVSLTLRSAGPSVRRSAEGCSAP